MEKELFVIEETDTLLITAEQPKSLDEITNISKDSGIYYFRNLINNKYYIGLAVELRTRLSSHMYNFKAERYDFPLYRALKKYGVENFEFCIVEYVHIETQKELKDELDRLEKHYIKVYNSYAPNGYNQTLGGDAGVLGYKMTEEQKAKISEAGKQQASDGRYEIYIYDIIDNKFYEFPNCVIAGKELNVSSNSLQNNKVKLAGKRYLRAKTKEELQQKIEEYKNTHNRDLLNYYNYIMERFKHGDLPSILKLSEELGVCRDTLNKRNKKLRELGYELPWKSNKNINDYNRN